MTKLKDFFIKLGGQLKSSLTRFPETLAVAYLLAILWIILNNIDQYSPTYESSSAYDQLLKVILMLAIALPYTAVIKLLTEYYLKGNLFRILGDSIVLISVIIGSILLPDKLAEREILLIVILIALGYLGFIIMPYLLKRISFPIYVLKIATTFFITILYSLVLYLGTISIVFALEQLFDLNVSYTLYTDIWIFIAGFFSVTFFLGNVPAKDALFDLTNYTKIYRYLFTIIIIPLLGIFTVILYAYFVKILIGGELPKGVIASLVLWYGLISGVILFFVQPLLESNLIARWFRRLYPFALMIPVGMMFYSLYLRIAQYGITPPRYYSVLAGIWILGTLVYTIAHKKFIPQILVLYGMILLFISVVGPLDAYKMTMRDQSSRFTKLLTTFDMLDEDGMIQPNSSLSEDEQKEVLSYIHYAEDIECLTLLKPVPKHYSYKTTKEILGFEDDFSYDYDNTSREYYYYSYYFDASSIIDITGYDRMTCLRNDDNAPSQYSSSIDNTTNTLSIYQDDVLLIDVDLKEWESKLEKYKQSDKSIATQDAYLVAENEQVRLKLFLDYYEYTYNTATDTYEDPTYRFYMFIGDK